MRAPCVTSGPRSRRSPQSGAASNGSMSQLILRVCRRRVSRLWTIESSNVRALSVALQNALDRDQIGDEGNERDTSVKNDTRESILSLVAGRTRGCHRRRAPRRRARAHARDGELSKPKETKSLAKGSLLSLSLSLSLSIEARMASAWSSVCVRAHAG